MLLHLFDNSLALGVHVAAVISLPIVAVEANGGVEVGNLVRILGRCWDFYRSCPIEVEMAKSEGEVLNV